MREAPPEPTMESFLGARGTYVEVHILRGHGRDPALSNARCSARYTCRRGGR